MKIYFTVVLIFVSITFASAQDKAAQTKELAGQVATFYQKGDFEQAIAAGKKLVELEKDSTASSSYTIAVINLARIERDYYIALRNKIAGGKPNFAERKDVAEKAYQIAKDAEQLFREALALNEKNGKAQTAQTADLKRDLAWIVYNHSSPDVKTIDQSRARIDEAEKLFLESIALSEQLRGKDADETLLVARDLGDFYFYYVNFEKALPYYERFIQTYGQKHGENSPELVRPLRSYANILFATMQNREAESAVRKIELISKSKEPLPEADLDLYLRSKDAVAATTPVFAEFNRQSEEFRAKLKAKGKSPDDVDRSELPRMIFVRVKVEVDETGKVTKAETINSNDRFKREAEEKVSTWIVRPFSYNGTSRKLRGILTYRKVASPN